MKNRLFKITLAGLFFLLSSAGALAWAGDSVTLTASLTIPSIPGVNAPLIETSSQDNTPAVDNSADNSSEEVLLAQTDAASQTIQTYYSR